MSSSQYYIDKGRHGEFESGKAQYYTPNFFDRLFLIRAYWNPKSRQGPGLGGLASRGAPVDKHGINTTYKPKYAKYLIRWNSLFLRKILLKVLKWI